MATSSRRVLWKGAISFGLVHIPVALHTAATEQGLDFDWLDKRTMDPVGYKRVNKRTGKEITREHIVKGIEYEDGQYVILSPEEIESAYPKTTQTIEIECFVPANEIPFVFFERPYYISPINRGNKVYALLREVLAKTGKVGIAKVVIQTKQHLAMLVPSGPALVLDLLRWGDEIRTWEDLDLPAEGVKAAGVTPKELAMGEQLVNDMTSTWRAEDFTDSFKEQILALVDQKVKAGKTEAVTQLEPVEKEQEGATIYDLTEMLRRSLKGGAKEARPAKAAAKTTARKAPAKTARKTAAKPASKAAHKTPARRKSA